MTDVVSDWMRVVRAHGVLLARNDLPAGWGFRLEARRATAFHVLTRGAAFLVVDAQPPIAIAEGDLVLLPRGEAHAMVSAVGVEPLSLEAMIAKASSPAPGDPRPETTLLCGEYGSDAQLEVGLWHAMPDVVHFTGAEIESDPSLRTTLALIERETETALEGSEVLVRYLLDALFVYLVRAWGRAREGTWIAGLGDPGISRTLHLLHSDPSRAWTVESLAHAVGQSRAAFARRFTERVGEPPMEYLTRWRMTLAARLLADTTLSIGEIAARAGYSSEFAFSRAFKRARGLAPTAYRRGLPARPSASRRRGERLEGGGVGLGAPFREAVDQEAEPAREDQHGA